MSDNTGRLGLPYMLTNQAQKEVVFNEAMDITDFWTARTVNSARTSPPGSPADGNAYLVTATATGDFAGREKQIAYRVNGAWMFLPPFVGASIFNLATSQNLTYDGTNWGAGDASGYEVTSNKVTSISAQSNDSQYPSAKCVYDAIQAGGGGGGTGKEDVANKVTSLSASSTDVQYPSAKCVYDIVGDIETLLLALL